VQWRGEAARKLNAVGGRGKGIKAACLPQARSPRQQGGSLLYGRPDMHRYFTTSFLIPICGHLLPGTSKE